MSNTARRWRFAWLRCRGADRRHLRQPGDRQRWRGLQLVAPELFEFETWPVEVELARGLSRGQTLVDWRRTLGEDAVHDSHPEQWVRVDIAMSCDPAQVLALFISSWRPQMRWRVRSICA
jgi:pyrimidine-specific ribonucleoside hydrolase